MRLAALSLAAVLALSACGGGDPAPKAAASPSPSVSPDRWALEMCTYLGQQDPDNHFSNDFAMTLAGKSTMPEVVDLAIKARQVGDANLLRAWCQEHVPQARVTPAQPKP
jgi:hypothetical protein